MTRPGLHCEHIEQNPHQCSMYYDSTEYCLPCIVIIYDNNQDPALFAGVLMEQHNQSALRERLRASRSLR